MVRNTPNDHVVGMMVINSDIPTVRFIGHSPIGTQKERDPYPRTMHNWDVCNLANEKKCYARIPTPRTAYSPLLHLSDLPRYLMVSHLDE